MWLLLRCQRSQPSPWAGRSCLTFGWLKVPGINPALPPGPGQDRPLLPSTGAHRPWGLPQGRAIPGATGEVGSGAQNCPIQHFLPSFTLPFVSSRPAWVPQTHAHTAHTRVCTPRAKSQITARAPKRDYSFLGGGAGFWLGLGAQQGLHSCKPELALRFGVPQEQNCTQPPLQPRRHSALPCFPPFCSSISLFKSCMESTGEKEGWGEGFGRLQGAERSRCEEHEQPRLPLRDAGAGAVGED